MNALLRELWSLEKKKEQGVKNLTLQQARITMKLQCVSFTATLESRSILQYSRQLIHAGNICFTTRQKDGACLMFTTQDGFHY